MENKEQGNTMEDIFGEVIYSYTRKQAIEDGVLVDVSEMAREAGIRFPVAVTSAVWGGYIVPNETLKGFGQSEEGRLWDVLSMFRNKAKRFGASILMFEVIFLTTNNGGGPKGQIVQLKAVCGPGDDGEPVITIMMHDED